MKSYKNTLPELTVVWDVAVREVSEATKRISKLQELQVLNGVNMKNGYFNGKGSGLSSLTQL